MVDPLRSILHFMHTGGSILWLILAVTVALWTLILERYWFFLRVYPSRARAWTNDWNRREERDSWCARRVREAIISRAGGQLRRTLPLINTLIAVCPLLGLLGTVTGMIQVFDVMALLGTSNARAMASGVSRATVPTMAGMVVALSGLYFSARFKQVTRRESQRLADGLRYG